MIQIIDHIENNLDQEKFGVEQLCEIMCMSSSTLYRKMKLITNKSSVEFIREVRIRKALEYLQKDSQLQVSEVSFMIGFEDVNYFRKCFKKQFGRTPSEILQKSSINKSV
jgi:AraC-like DNA-binding protein